jgi:glycosyltransferase involved in cell wall biosynthesis
VIPDLLELAVVIPTFNERANVPLLIAKLDEALAGRNWEAIFVDDNSPDGTADAARELGRRDARAGDPADRAAGTFLGVHRGHVRDGGAVRGGDRRRPPA